MLWKTICGKGFVPLTKICSKINCANYKDILQVHLCLIEGIILIAVICFSIVTIQSIHAISSSSDICWKKFRFQNGHFNQSDNPLNPIENVLIEIENTCGMYMWTSRKKIFRSGIRSTHRKEIFYRCDIKVKTSARG